MINRNKCIDKQIALRPDCIYNIENADLEIGVSGKYLHLLSYFDTHIYVLVQLAHFTPYASTFLFVCLFDLILNIPVSNFFIHVRTGLPRFNQY